MCWHIIFSSLSYLIFLPLCNQNFCYRRTVRDPQTGQDVVLCDADVDIIQRLQAQKIPDANFDDAAVSAFNVPVCLLANIGYFLEHFILHCHFC